MNTTLSFASALSFALLHSLWQVALVALLAALGFSAMPGATARVRHTLGMVGLVAMAVAPLVTFFMVWHSPSPVAPAEISWRAHGSLHPIPQTLPPCCPRRLGAMRCWSFFRRFGWPACC